MAADHATSADFALHPARLASAESSLAASVAWGNRQDREPDADQHRRLPGHLLPGRAGPRARHRCGRRFPCRLGAYLDHPRHGTDPGRRQGAHRAGARAGTPAATPAGSAPRAAAATAGQALAAARRPAGPRPSAASPPPTMASSTRASASAATATGPRTSGPTTRVPRAGTSWPPRSPNARAPAYGFIRGKLYVVGGRDGAGRGIRGGEVYDPATDTWSQIADAPLGYGGSAFGVVGDSLYVIGGCDFDIGCGTTDVQIYHPATDTWSVGKPYPQPISYSACGTVEGALTCAGGAYEPAGGASQDTPDTYRLDASTGAWKKLADAPADFWGAAGTSAGGRLLVAGGAQLSTNSVSGRTYSYDPGSDTWTELPGLPQPQLLGEAAPGWYLTGGEGADGGILDSALELPGWDAPHADLPWLSESAKSLTLKGGELHHRQGDAGRGRHGRGRLRRPPGRSRHRQRHPVRLADGAAHHVGDRAGRLGSAVGHGDRHDTGRRGTAAGRRGGGRLQERRHHLDDRRTGRLPAVAAGLRRHR